MTDQAWTEGSLNRHETLAALPTLLSLARQVVVTAFNPGDPEIEALKALLDECVIGAHRVCLREKIHAAAMALNEGG